MLAWNLQEGLHVDTNTSTETRMLTFNLQFIKEALCLLLMLEDYFGLKNIVFKSFSSNLSQYRFDVVIYSKDIPSVLDEFKAFPVLC